MASIYRRLGATSSVSVQASGVQNRLKQGLSSPLADFQKLLPRAIQDDLREMQIFSGAVSVHATTYVGDGAEAAAAR